MESVAVSGLIKYAQVDASGCWIPANLLKLVLGVLDSLHVDKALFLGL